jgi:hypothetical protein
MIDLIDATAVSSIFIKSKLCPYASSSETEERTMKLMCIETGIFQLKNPHAYYENKRIETLIRKSIFPSVVQ